MLGGPSIHLRILTCLKSVQRRATWWIKSSFDSTTLRWTKSGSECLNELRWISLEPRHNYMCVVLLYAILNNFTPIKFSDYFQLNDFSTHSHPFMILPFPFSINAFRYSFLLTQYFYGIQSLLICSQLLWTILNVNLNNFYFDCNVICVCVFVLT